MASAGTIQSIIPPFYIHCWQKVKQQKTWIPKFSRLSHSDPPPCEWKWSHGERPLNYVETIYKLSISNGAIFRNRAWPILFRVTCHFSDKFVSFVTIIRILLISRHYFVIETARVTCRRTKQPSDYRNFIPSFNTGPINRWTEPFRGAGSSVFKVGLHIGLHQTLSFSNFQQTL